MAATSALTLAAASAIPALAAGVVAGVWLAPRLAERRRKAATERSGITVAEMLQQIVAHASLGIAVVDSYRDVVYLNERANELGLVHGKLLDDEAWTAAQRALAGEDEVIFDLSVAKRAPGATRTELSAVHGYARLLSDEDSRFAVVIVDDQSEQARMEASRRDFVANVSHELKTPVGAMGLLAEALLASADDPEAVRPFAERVLVEANRLASMIGELIELSRLQGADPLPDLGVVDVDEVVNEAISRHKVAADNAEITITTDAPSGLRVLGDEPLLVTALANLVSNAIAYSPHGSPVSISRRRRDNFIEMAVTDRGIGIAPKDQLRVFERFFRSDKARSRATGGTGLGLAIVKHVAANHNGTITLWSQPGTGSTFTLAIPAYQGSVDQEKEES
ncbi:sensor histidine kinase [Mycolicibacter arupensis]|uniref:sensor histidine kinase n=1 Tax=Mycolicibacter arupensis TaxID=342002 RepID=UPI003B3A630C